MPDHAICITGLQRSFAEISGNIKVAMAGLHGGPSSKLVWFGVRPPQDSWAEVRARLPPLQTEVQQQQCTSGKPVTWYSAYSRGGSKQFWHTYHIWVQTLCDQLLCDQINGNGSPPHGLDRAQAAFSDLAALADQYLDLAVIGSALHLVR